MFLTLWVLRVTDQELAEVYGSGIIATPAPKLKACQAQPNSQSISSENQAYREQFRGHVRTSKIGRSVGNTA